MFKICTKKLNKNVIMKKSIVLLTLLIVFGCASNRNTITDSDSIVVESGATGTKIQIEFIKGNQHNHPSFAIWIEDMEGNYIETIFVTEYVAKGKFRYSELSPGKWQNEPGFVRRPATLPYWAHKRNIKAPDGLYIPSPDTPVPDAITGATPRGNFTLNANANVLKDKKFRVLMEINQPWDSNKYWTNNKYEGDNDYFASLQPALIYAVTIDPGSELKEFILNPIGHSHPSGKNGQLYTDLSTLTTAREIASKITVRFL
jgi:hypothetical protein